MGALTFRTPRRRFKPSGLQQTHRRSRFLLPRASLSESFQSAGTVQRHSPPTPPSRPTRFKISPQSYVASAGTTIGPDEGPKLPCGFKKKKKKKRRPSRPLDYCLGKPEISGAPIPPPSLPTHTHTHRAADTDSYEPPHPGSISRHFAQKKYYLLIPECPFRYFLTFHFLFHSVTAEAPRAPPPLQFGPSSPSPPPSWVRRPVTVGYIFHPHNTLNSSTIKKEIGTVSP